MICLVSAAAAEGLPPPPVSAAPMMPQVNVVLKADGLGPLEALRQIVLSISSQCTDVIVVIPYHTIPYHIRILY